MACQRTPKGLATGLTYFFIWLTLVVSIAMAMIDFLIQTADRTRPGDYVRIMRGDLYFETGKPDLAREVYKIVERSSSSAAKDAKARLSALDRGGVEMSDIKALRQAAGAQCTMCHSR